MTFIPQNPDLHSHSVASDGTLTPAELAERARAGGVDLWALTDHDELSAQAAAQAAARAHGLHYLTGVEISVTYCDTTVHVVGLGVDPADARLVQGLADTRDGRGPRAVEIGRELARAGIEGAYEGALRHAGNPRLIARPHFARHLVDVGVCRDTAEVFRKYLVEGKPGYVPHRWARLADALGWITGAGGVAVLAHPARYRFAPAVEDALLTEFIEGGGRAVEVVTGSHTAQEAARYADVARRRGLAASRGSDFHSPGESHCALGALAPLPADLTPVWSLLEGRIQAPV